MDALQFVEMLHDSPIISAVKSTRQLDLALQGEGRIVFVLYGDVMSIGDIVDLIRQAGKVAMVHVDLIEGLASRDIAVDFIAAKTSADGILSTKANLVRRAKACGLLGVQRFFVLDSMALANMEKQFPLDYADAIEVLPGPMPKIIRTVAQKTDKPVIAGGLIFDKEDVVNVLGAGAVAVSSTNTDIWAL